jgi:hypothetical protein
MSRAFSNAQFEIFEKGNRLSYDVLYLYDSGCLQDKAAALEIAYEILQNFAINIHIEMCHQMSLETWFESMHLIAPYDMIIFVTACDVEPLIQTTKTNLNIPVFHLALD